MMLINEVILDEDTTETKDLMAVANYVSKWMTSEAGKKYEGKKLTLNQIHHAWGQPLPKIQSETVKYILSYPLEGLTYEPLRFVFNGKEESEENELGAFFPPPEQMINIHLELILHRGRNSASILLHELQHALDDFKSSGRAFYAQKYADHNQDMKAYMSHPMEINARFAQSLWDMAAQYESIARSDVYAAITQNLEKHKLRASDFPDQRAYKRLISRAYKFLSEVGQVIDMKQENKPTFVQKVKYLIKKWTSSIF